MNERQQSDHALRSALHDSLQGGTSVVLATLSVDERPSTAFCSWVLSLAGGQIAVALDSRSTAHHNITQGRTAVALEVLADELVLSVRGVAHIVKEQLRSVPFPCSLVSVSVDEVRDHAVQGVHFQAPRYMWADGKEHRGEVERAIFKELAES